MNDDLIPPPLLPRVDVLDAAGAFQGRFPAGRVFCVGRNYAEHAREMGADPDREAPFFFIKPASSVCTQGEVPWPSMTEDLHHEVELVLAIDRPLRDATPQECARAVVACAVGLDLTRRDLQAVAKAAGRPWEAGKVFDGAAVVGPLLAGRAVLDAPDAEIVLEVEGAVRQSGRLGQMIWRPGEVLARLSELFGLRAGDLVFTGTPAGVGALAPGDGMRARIDGLPELVARMAAGPG